MSDFVQVIKKAAVDAMKAESPADFTFGMVVSTDPLKIQIDQKLTLTMAQLVLTRNVTDYEVDMEVNHLTEDSGGFSHSHTVTAGSHTGSTNGVAIGDHGEHSHIVSVTEGQGTTDSFNRIDHKHAYIGVKKFKVSNSLKVNEKVVLARIPGGQKYIVMDRVVM